eukprot:CAMPEP_0180140236 /NCGR_PEP_ID=MMETSP0986-20121125/14088_1 /TAXON_ID=697907 /ORGANISM="non described non described, Strain CCMP2293" /LENGTH=236 /DNA_ID=CAMNT_0022082651 /DNA_START=105 /DNA_END=815 /DNA_ORIENTATION=+
MTLLRASLLASCVAAASAFSLVPSSMLPSLRAGSISTTGARAPARTAACSMSMSARAEDIPEVEFVKIFGRLGEKTLFGDGSAGACCHSGCENCEWRYTFDILQSARPKWIPAYSEKIFDDGREHHPKWKTLFADEAKIGKEAFLANLKGLKFDMPLGPAGFLTAKQADYSDEAGDAVWERLSKGKDTLTTKQMSIRLRKMSPGEEGIMWSDFLTATVAREEEEEEELEPIIISME